MRRHILVVTALVMVLVTVPAVVAAQADQEAPPITHGKFAQLLLEALATKGAPSAAPATALRKVQDLGLMLPEWQADSAMTHGELAVVMSALGVTYVPPDEAETVSVPFANAILRRYLAEIKHTRGTLFHHCFSDSSYMDQGVDRAVSPSDFER